VKDIFVIGKNQNGGNIDYRGKKIMQVSENKN
jgi:hypothetical protein